MIKKIKFCHGLFITGEVKKKHYKLAYDTKKKNIVPTA